MKGRDVLSLVLPLRTSSPMTIIPAVWMYLPSPSGFVVGIGDRSNVFAEPSAVVRAGVDEVVAMVDRVRTGLWIGVKDG